MYKYNLIYLPILIFKCMYLNYYNPIKPYYGSINIYL